MGIAVVYRTGLRKQEQDKENVEKLKRRQK